MHYQQLLTTTQSLDDSNTINLKLFPTRSLPPPVHAWHVPLSTVQLSALNTSFDLTLLRIIPFINGIQSVSQIAQLADTDLSLTRKAVRHLLYYGCIILLDIFQFGAVYAPTAEIGAFVEDKGIQEECLRYVIIPVPSNSSYGPASSQPRNVHTTDATAKADNDQTNCVSSHVTCPTPHRPTITTHTLAQLYTSLRQGVPLHKWVLEHAALLAGIDVRRLVTFGVIKGFLYRAHRYVVAAHGYSRPGSKAANLQGGKEGENSGEGDEGEGRGGVEEQLARVEGHSEGAGLPLARYLDGMHCFDEICTELQMSERQAMEKIGRAYGEVHVLQR